MNVRIYGIFESSQEGKINDSDAKGIILWEPESPRSTIAVIRNCPENILAIKVVNNVVW